MGAGLLDAVLGAAAVLLVLRFRRRLAWLKPAIRGLGVLGTSLAVMGTAIFVGGALFALRLMPGPAFTLGAVVTSAVILADRRRTDGLRLIPRLPSRQRPDPRVLLEPLVLLGVLAGAAGLAIAFYAAWITDVADVQAILRAVT
jgi:hypothetical protein